MELIIIKTNKGKEIKKILEEKQIAYEIYQEPQLNWEAREKSALKEWEKLTDEELINEWEKLPHEPNS